MTIKLTRDSVLDIRRSLWNGVPIHELCSIYGISPTTVDFIKMGRTWRSVPWPDGSIGSMPKRRRAELMHGLPEGKRANETELDQVIRMMREGGASEFEIQTAIDNLSKKEQSDGQDE